MKNPKYLELTDDELERLQKRKQQNEPVKVDLEWRLLAEFGYYFGWRAVEAVRNNEIGLDVFNTLLAGARKVWSSRVLDLSQAIYAGIAANKSKKPQTVLDANLKEFIKDVRP